MHLSTTPRSVRVIPFIPVTFPQLVNFPDHPGAMFPRQERTLLRFSISKHAALPAHPDDQMEQQQVLKQSIRAVCEPHRSMTQQLAAPRPSWLRADTGPILLPRRYPASALEGQRQRHSASGPLHPLEVPLLDLQSHTLHPQGHATISDRGSLSSPHL